MPISNPEIPDIVDAHQHFWDLERHSYPWLFSSEPSIVGDPSPIRRSYMPRDYVTDAAPYRVTGTVHLDGGFDPADPVGETRFVDEIARSNGFPNAIVGGVALDDPNVEATIEAHLAASDLVRGLRQIVAWHAEPRLSYVTRPDMMRQPDWLRGFGLLRRHDLSFDMQLYPSQMEDAAHLAALYEDVQLIVDQIGMPVGFENGIPSDWLAGMRRLARHPNVSVKVSGLGMLHPDWTPEQLRPLVRAALDAFGPRRIMFASNYPVDKLFRPLSKIIEAFDAATSDLSHDERSDLFAHNAIRIYRMHLPDETTTDGEQP